MPELSATVQGSLTFPSAAVARKALKGLLKLAGEPARESLSQLKPAAVVTFDLTVTGSAEWTSAVRCLQRLATEATDGKVAVTLQGCADVRVVQSGGRVVDETPLLPEGALARYGDMRLRASGGGHRYAGHLNAGALSPDGTMLALATSAQSTSLCTNGVGLWRWPEGTLIDRYLGRHTVHELHFSADSRLLLARTEIEEGKRSKTGAVLIDLTEKACRTLDSRSAAHIRLSPDGTRAAIAKKRTIELKDTTTGRKAATTGTDDTIHSLDFSPDGRWLIAFSGDNTVHIWSADKLHHQARFTVPGRSVYQYPDGVRAISDKAFAVLSDSQILSCHTLPDGASTPIPECLTNADGSGLSGTTLYQLRRSRITNYDMGDRRMVVLDTATGQHTRHTAYHPYSLRRPLALLPDDRTLLFEGEGVRPDLLDAGADAPRQGTGHGGLVDAVVASDTHAVTARDYAVHRWSLTDGGLVWERHFEEEGLISKLTLAADGSAFHLTSWGEIRRTAPDGTGEVVLKLEHPDRVYTHPDGWLLIVKGRTLSWGRHGQAERRALEVPPYTAHIIPLPDRRVLLTDYSHACILDLTADAIGVHVEQRNIGKVARQPDGSFRFLNNDGVNVVRSADDLSVIDTGPKIDLGRFEIAALSPDGQLAALRQGPLLRLVSLTDGQTRWIRTARLGDIGPVTFTPDCTRLVSCGGNGCAVVWSVAAGPPPEPVAPPPVRRPTSHPLADRALAVLRRGGEDYKIDQALERLIPERAERGSMLWVLVRGGHPEPARFRRGWFDMSCAEYDADDLLKLWAGAEASEVPHERPPRHPRSLLWDNTFSGLVRGCCTDPAQAAALLAAAPSLPGPIRGNLAMVLLQRGVIETDHPLATGLLERLARGFLIEAYGMRWAALPEKGRSALVLWGEERWWKACAAVAPDVDASIDNFANSNIENVLKHTTPEGIMKLAMWLPRYTKHIPVRALVAHGPAAIPVLEQTADALLGVKAIGYDQHSKKNSSAVGVLPALAVLHRQAGGVLPERFDPLYTYIVRKNASAYPQDPEKARLINDGLAALPAARAEPMILASGDPRSYVLGCTTEAVFRAVLQRMEQIGSPHDDRDARKNLYARTNEIFVEMRQADAPLLRRLLIEKLAKPTFKEAPRFIRELARDPGEPGLALITDLLGARKDLAAAARTALLTDRPAALPHVRAAAKSRKKKLREAATALLAELEG